MIVTKIPQEMLDRMPRWIPVTVEPRERELTRRLRKVEAERARILRERVRRRQQNY
jgi:hypothetical protein